MFLKLAELNLIFSDNGYVLYIYLLSHKSQTNSESMELLCPSDSFYLQCFLCMVSEDYIVKYFAACFTCHFQGAVVARKLSPKIPLVVELLIAHGAGESKLLLVFNFSMNLHTITTAEIFSTLVTNMAYLVYIDTT